MTAARRCAIGAWSLGAAPARRCAGRRRQPAGARTRSSATRIPQPLTGDARRRGARPRHRRQPAVGPVPAVPQRADPRGALPGRPGARPGRRGRALDAQAQLRLRLVDARRLNPATHHAGVLPHRRPDARRRGLARQAVLDAQQIEDVVALPAHAARLMRMHSNADAAIAHAADVLAGAGLARCRWSCARRGRADELAAAIAAFTGGAPVRDGQGRRSTSRRWSRTATPCRSR